MATLGHIVVWVKLEDGVHQRDSTSVKVPSDAIVDDVIDAALDKMLLKLDPSLVVHKLKGEEVKRDCGVSSLATSCDEPIILTVNRARGQGTCAWCAWMYFV